MLDIQSQGHSVAFIMNVPLTLHLLRSEVFPHQLGKGGTCVLKSNLSLGLHLHRFVGELSSSAGCPGGAGVVSQWVRKCSVEHSAGNPTILR